MKKRNEMLQEYQNTLHEIRKDVKLDDEKTAAVCAIAMAMPFLMGILFDIRDAVVEIKDEQNRQNQTH